ncbi:uncharacterized protein LY79DRAFT_547059 [Colletotrichum navitas]|uniref:Uncharacterized protein n=1 Tax=Colletotrichum navitas TaxID=681940 RepID=A0AAD8Q3F3_9PEZI|nr:uncharacterized protein LY79DRAFT_547059 [Colletotrichum navitas]KAK1595216.1 hypothetical protein LY79DRAFT_547059 [Colletotrichum navitas]
MARVDPRQYIISSWLPMVFLIGHGIRLSAATLEGGIQDGEGQAVTSKTGQRHTDEVWLHESNGRRRGSWNHWKLWECSSAGPPGPF